MNTRSLKTYLSILTILSVLWPSLVPMTVSAAPSIDELQAQIGEKQGTIAELEEEIAKTQSQLDNI